jgi:hypothetical protein
MNRALTMAEFAEIACGRKSADVGRRTVLRERIPYYVVNGHWMVLEADVEAWRQARMKTPEAPSLKSLLRQISEKVLEKRKGAEDEAAPGKESHGMEHRECSTP